VRGRGFENARFRGHSFIMETDEAGYMLTIVERAIDTSRATRRFGDDTAALKAEARRRVEEGTFFGRIAYVSRLLPPPAPALVPGVRPRVLQARARMAPFRARERT
jgi:orotidine-5'-phosphate decarboxylase